MNQQEYERRVRIAQLKWLLEDNEADADLRWELGDVLTETLQELDS